MPKEYMSSIANKPAVETEAQTIANTEKRIATYEAAIQNAKTPEEASKFTDKLTEELDVLYAYYEEKSKDVEDVKEKVKEVKAEAKKTGKINKKLLSIALGAVASLGMISGGLSIIKSDNTNENTNNGEKIEQLKEELSVEQDKVTENYEALIHEMSLQTENADFRREISRRVLDLNPYSFVRVSNKLKNLDFTDMDETAIDHEITEALEAVSIDILDDNDSGYKEDVVGSTAFNQYLFANLVSQDPLNIEKLNLDQYRRLNKKQIYMLIVKGNARRLYQQGYSSWTGRSVSVAEDGTLL